MKSSVELEGGLELENYSQLIKCNHHCLALPFLDSFGNFPPGHLM